jgi:hypothetical protein
VAFAGTSAMICEEELTREKQKGSIATQRIRIPLRYHENCLVLELKTLKTLGASNRNKSRKWHI